MILNTLPSSVKFAGLVEVNCGSIRDFIGKKHGEVAEKIMDHLTADAQGKTDTICTAFQQMLEIVEKPPGSVEEVAKLREYLEELPKVRGKLAPCSLLLSDRANLAQPANALQLAAAQLVEEQQDAIDAIGAIKDELEACQYGISDEAFSQMYKAIMWPAEIAQTGEALKPILEKKQEDFFGIMEGEQRKYYASTVDLGLFGRIF